MATRNEESTPGVSAKADEITYSTEKASNPRAGLPPAHSVLIPETGEKRKRRYSQGARGVQSLERGVTASLETLSDGVARMFKVYNKKREKSSRKKRDGALRDGLQNWAKALGEGLSVAGNAPLDFVKGVNKSGGSKQIRKTVRLLMPPPLR